MPSGSNLLTELQAAGLSLALELKVTPASRLTPELRQIIREHKPELLRHLSHVAPDGGAVKVSDTGEAHGCKSVVWEPSERMVN